MSRSGTPTLPIAEKRSGKRVDTLLPITALVGGRRFAFEIQNISLTGARLHGPLTLTLGQRLNLVLELVAQSPLDVVAEVVRVHTDDLVTDTAAVRFIDPPPAVLAAIAAHMKGLGLDDEEERVTARIPVVTDADAADTASTTPLERHKKRID